MLRTQRKSLFTLRKQNFKLKPCNHHIKGLPFFGPPLECGVNARAVFFIRFFCFFSWSGKLTYSRLNTRRSLGKEHSSNLHSSKTLEGLFTWSKKQPKKEFMLRVSLGFHMAKKERWAPSMNATTTWKRPTFSLHHCHLFMAWTYSRYLMGHFVSSPPKGDVNAQTPSNSKDKQAYKSCSSYPHWQFSTFKFMLPLFLEKSNTALCQIAVPPQILWSNAFGPGWDEEAGLWFFFTSHWVSFLPPFTFKKIWQCTMAVWGH